MTLRPVTADKLADLYHRQRDNIVLKRFRNGEKFIQPVVNRFRPTYMFVGQVSVMSMKYIDEGMEYAGIDPAQAHFTDLFKHRWLIPPDEDVLATALRFVEDEVSLLHPRVVVPIGQHALNAFFQVAAISNVHGQAYHWGKHWLVPMIAPSQCIIASDEKLSDLFDDLATVEQYGKKKLR